jgi:hypothetical protein
MSLCAPVLHLHCALGHDALSGKLSDERSTASVPGRRVEKNQRRGCYLVQPLGRDAHSEKPSPWNQGAARVHLPEATSDCRRRSACLLPRGSASVHVHSHAGNARHAYRRCCSAKHVLTITSFACMQLSTSRRFPTASSLDYRTCGERDVLVADLLSPHPTTTWCPRSLALGSQHTLNLQGTSATRRSGAIRSREYFTAVSMLCVGSQVVSWLAHPALAQCQMGG